MDYETIDITPTWLSILKMAMAGGITGDNLNVLTAPCAILDSIKKFRKEGAEMIIITFDENDCIVMRSVEK